MTMTNEQLLNAIPDWGMYSCYVLKAGVHKGMAYQMTIGKDGDRWVIGVGAVIERPGSHVERVMKEFHSESAANNADEIIAIAQQYIDDLKLAAKVVEWEDVNL